jgi:hypothetical protein
MKRSGIRVIALCLLPAIALSVAGCKSNNAEPAGSSSPAPPPRPVDFDVPTAAQAADKAYPPGDRTPQAFQDVANRNGRLVAVGFDESFNISRPLFVSSDDGGSTWARRDLDPDSVARSGTLEGARVIAAGPSGFVAAGSTNDGPVTWLSPDGTSWKRLPKDRKAFAATDEISAITATAEGFSMVGTSSLKNGGNSNHLVYWRSSDGVAWQRLAGPAIGLKPTRAGRVYAAGIVATGKVIVVSGGVSGHDGTAEVERIQFWYSGDSGKTFRSSAIRGEAATAYMYNNVLAVGGGKIVALAQGHGYDESETGSWDGVVLEGGSSGSAWQVAEKPWALGSTYQDAPGTLTRTSKQWVATSRTTTNTEDIAVAAGPTWKQLSDCTDIASQRGRGDQIVTGSVASGDDVVLVGWDNRSGTTEPAVWRYRDGTVTPANLPREAFGGRASTRVAKIVSTKRDLVAVGDISGMPTGWAKAGSGWQADTLTGRKDGIDASLIQAATTADGRTVAVGGKYLAIGRRAAMWVRDKNGSWAEVDSPVFGVQAKSPFGGPSPAAVAIGPRRWVVVGQRHDGDLHYDAWSVSSADGKSWVEGRGDQAVRPEPKSNTRRTPWRNFRSTGSGPAEMTSVVADGLGFVAGGQSADGSPVVWLSPDGVSWPSMVRLPMAKGVHAANLRTLERIGNTLVGVGDFTRFDGDTEGGWTSWTSTNGGRTWTANQPTVPTHAFPETLVSVPQGVVALGVQGEGDELDAAAWFSRDGRSWRAIPLSGDRIKGPGRQGFSSGVVHDGKLLATAYDVPPSGGGYYTLELELPK